MEYEFYLQDPTSPETLYLLEAMFSAAEQATIWEGVFAFASRAGVDTLMADPVVERFLGRGRFSLLVGLDAVTNRSTLERLQELEREFERLEVRVFWNQTAGLFHPKVSRFQYIDGRQTVIVGSGNLTPGGLRENFEAYSVLRSAPEEALDMSAWDRFLRDHSDHIREIDEEALERAARNIMRGGRRRHRRALAEVEPGAAVLGEEEEGGGEPEPVEGADRVLVARVPKAGGRWGQIHYNRDVVERFFRVRADSTQRVYLVERHQDGSAGDQEVRPCVYSQTNKNFKIELQGARGRDYPDDAVPIVVFRELQARAFEYMLLMPGDPGHREMLQLTDDLPSVGRGFRRVMTRADEVRRRWAGCPLLVGW